MNVLSLFDGISAGQLALQRAGLKVENYFASEIDPYAIEVTQYNYPNTSQLGCIKELTSDDFEFLPKIDLLMGGSPCQNISNMGNGKGLEGDKSSLFYHYLRLKNELKPDFFLLENVCGSKKAIEAITNMMEVEPVLVNSSLVSGQSRSRYYWTDIPFEFPKDKQIVLKDILDETISENHTLTPGRLRWLLSDKGQETVRKKYASIDPIKAQCLTARSDASWNCNYVTRNGQITKLSPEEYEKLQTLPVGYTKCVRTSERYKSIGNSWTVDVITHIFKSLKWLY